MNCDGYVIAMSGEMFVDGVVDTFPNEMMKRRAIVDVTDVHPGTLSDGF